MAVTIKRTFILATLDELDTIPIKEGNWIALTDADGMFYDTGNPAGTGTNVVRREISGRTQFVTELPEVGDENNVYVLDTQSTLVGTDQPYYEVYCWENSAWQKIATNTQDINVNSVVSSSTKAYITGSAVRTSNTGILVKREDVFISEDGIISARGFTGGSIDSAKEAIHAVNADNADIAEKDTSDNMINAYYKDVNVSGRDLVFTRGNGTTKSITTPFTDVVSVNSNGLAPKMPTDPAMNILSRNNNNAAEWLPLDVSNLPAKSATYDHLNNDIASTYVAGMSFDNNTRKLTYTNGGGSTIDDITIPDTSYNDYSGPGNGHGLVPASNSGDAQRYFRVDGTWQVLPTYTGATGSVNGTAGLVKAPQAGDVDKFLKGDGTWGVTPYPNTFVGSTEGLVPSSSSNDDFLRSDGSWVKPPVYQGATTLANGTQGAVPAPTTAQKDYFLKGDGNWSALPTMVGATSSANGASGTVPAPTSSDTAKFLRGDGTWGAVNIPVFTSNANGLVPMSDTTSSDVYLNATGGWSTPALNTAGASESSTSTDSFSDTFYGDSATTSFTLEYAPIAGSLHVYVDGVESTTYTTSDRVITFQTAPTLTTETETFSIAAGQSVYEVSKAITSIVSVKVSGVTILPTVDYIQTGYNQITLIPTYTTGATLEIVYTHAQEIVANYDASLANAKMFLVAAPTQNDVSNTFTDSQVYISADKLYSNNKQVATVDDIPTIPGVFNVDTNGLVPGPTSADPTKYLSAAGTWTSPLPTIVTDTSFTPISGLTVTSKRYGHSYYITIDGTLDTGISAGGTIATTTTTFGTVYALGGVSSTQGAGPVLFTLSGNSVTSNIAIAANDSITVSFNALA